MPNTRVREVKGFTDSAVDEAVEVIKSGGLVVYPTETCYGLGADALNPEAVRKVFMVKHRPFNIPLTVLVADLEMWGRFAELTSEALKLIRKFMPGPLTIALRKKPYVPDLLDPYELAARISSHPTAQALVSKVGSPITATSANVHGEPEPYTVDEAIKSLGQGVDLALDSGKIPRRKVSTVVHLTASPPRILRAYPKGAFKTEDILKTLKENG